MTPMDDYSGPFDPTFHLGMLSRRALTVLGREYQLAAHLQDRVGIPQVLARYGSAAMREIAIAEWMGASPVYTQRMQRALRFPGDDVATIFKGMQFDVGAPHGFLDFRFRLLDDGSGEFWLPYCGALMDVEPMGEAFVVGMCHEIEDPTFDATAIATNRRARIRPIHRPPRRPADRHPHCAWTVTIEPDRDELPLPADAVDMFTTQAGSVALSPIDESATDGFVDYRGPLFEDIQFREWSHTALVRIAEEVALQHQLLALGFLWSVRRQAETEEQAREIYGKQLTGIAGLAADRLRQALDLPRDAAGLASVIALHPCLGPVQYTGVTVRADGDDVVVTIPSSSAAVDDGGWLSLIDSDHLEPLQAIATAVDEHWEIADSTQTDAGLEVRFRVGERAHKESGEVAIARFSSGSTFEFTDRGRSIPITPVGSSA